MASIFTRIINGEIPCYKIAEDENFISFLDINPLKKGHALVIPKKEIDYIFDIENDLLADMMVFAKEVATDVVFIDDGVIKEKNNPQEFFNNPQDDRLKEFLSKVL